VKWLAALLLALPVSAEAATAYVSDELVLGMFSEPNGQGQRLATLHSGASLETLGVNGEFTQVRLNDGTTGWVKSTFLTPRVPATVRIKQLEEELDRSHATTPALAEAAARSEAAQLKRELADKQAELDAAHTAAPGSDAPPASPAVLAVHRPWLPFGAVAVGLALGFWLGYATLARRVKRKFGGVKVY
jgi:uncharacterized protein YgiM (DUF1202 family)